MVTGLWSGPESSGFRAPDVYRRVPGIVPRAALRGCMPAGSMRRLITRTVSVIKIAEPREPF